MHNSFDCQKHPESPLAITRRGVLWLGQTCNLRCHFCYFQNRIKDPKHPDHPFMSLEKATAICTGLREHYGNAAVDIQGGEPTIYPDIVELVSRCNKMGLAPTLITNGLVLEDMEKCKALNDAGVHDLLISVHGLGDVYDAAVGVAGASDKQMRALRNCIDQGIAFRFNTVLAASVLPQLTQVVQLALESGARVVNFIAFNPFEDQQDSERGRYDVSSYSDVANALRPALDLCRANGLEANVRYLPLCVLPEQYREHFYNFQQLPYDPREWDYASWSWTAQNPQRRREGELTPFISLREANKKAHMFKDVATYQTDVTISLDDEYRHSAWVRAREHCGYAYAEQCHVCGLKGICDGIHGDYAVQIGTHEAKAELGVQTDNPCHYIRNQAKWADK